MHYTYYTRFGARTVMSQEPTTMIQTRIATIDVTITVVLSPNRLHKTKNKNALSVTLKSLRDNIDNYFI